MWSVLDVVCAGGGLTWSVLDVVCTGGGLYWRWSVLDVVCAGCSLAGPGVVNVLVERVFLFTKMFELSQ